MIKVKHLHFQEQKVGGMYASGGRGYDVYVVTNLLDYMTGETPIEGSLRYGLKSNTNYRI